MSEALPLFRRFPRLAERLPRVPLGDWPTPVRRLWRLGGMMGAPNLWIKREDLSATNYGGNKLRGLEFLLGDVKAQGATSILTMGAAGSFHVRATAVAAGQAGLKVSAILLHQPRAGYVRQNLLMAVGARARLLPVRLPNLPVRLAVEMIRRDAVSGRRPYFIPPGGTSPLACIGHVNAAFELRDQIDAGRLPEPQFLFVPLGSLGTAAGLAAGCALAGLATRIVGIVVFHPWYCTSRRWCGLARRTLALMRKLDPSVPAVAIRERRLTVIREALGRGYGHFTAAGARMARQLLRTEGVPLDGTYTAKMYAAAISYMGRRRGLDRAFLLWHTYCPAGVEAPADPAALEAIPRGLRGYFTRPLQALDEESAIDLARDW